MPPGDAKPGCGGWCARPAAGGGGFDIQWGTGRPRWDMWGAGGGPPKPPGGGPGRYPPAMGTGKGGGPPYAPGTGGGPRIAMAWGGSGGGPPGPPCIMDMGAWPGRLGCGTWPGAVAKRVWGASETTPPPAPPPPDLRAAAITRSACVPCRTPGSSRLKAYWIVSGRPARCWPFIASMALSAASKESNSTKPKPLAAPVSASCCTRGWPMTIPKAAKVSWSNFSSTSGDRPPTYSLAPTPDCSFFAEERSTRMGLPHSRSIPSVRHAYSASSADRISTKANPCGAIERASTGATRRRLEREA